MKILKTRRKKFLFVFVLLLIIIVSLYFKQMKNLVNVAFKSERSLFIEQSMKRSNGLFYGTDILAEVVKSKKCQNSPYCIEFENTGDDWYGITHNGYPIPLTSSHFAVKLKLRNTGGSVGINFVGSLPENDIEWWKGRKSINIFTLYDNLKVYIDNGVSKDSAEMLSKKISTEADGFRTIYIIFINKGERVILADSKGDFIDEIDLKKINPVEFTKGFFTDNNLYLGLSVEPKSKITIVEFIGFMLP